MRDLSSTASHRVRMPGFMAAGGTGGVAEPLAEGCGGAGVAIGCDAAWSGMAIPFDREATMRPVSWTVRRC
jgi:hypothetical protein